MWDVSYGTRKTEVSLGLREVRTRAGGSGPVGLPTFGDCRETMGEETVR